MTSPAARSPQRRQDGHQAGTEQTELHDPHQVALAAPSHQTGTQTHDEQKDTDQQKRGHQELSFDDPGAT
ncbi:Uncharacterised protein [Mycobacteroides abscessus subsp. abscessus]|nr:Uncharacterised protein [Mycobacteroides abscessus subsp. abscessus]